MSDLDINKYGLSDNDITDVEVMNDSIRLHLMSNDLPYIETTRDDVIDMAKALGITDEDLK